MAVATATAPKNGAGTGMTTVPDESRTMQYVPFASKESIKLSVAIVQNLICVPTKSGKRCSESDAIKFMMLCKARGLNPFEGDAFLIGYEAKDGAPPSFSLITSHQAFLKRAEVHPEYDGMESGLIVRTAEGEILDRDGDFFFDGEDGDFLLGAWATVHFKNRKFPMKKRVRLATFAKGYGRWKEDPAGMIVKVAEADALRSSFPTMLGGLYSQEESPVPTEATVTTSAPPLTELPKGRAKIGGGVRKQPAPTKPAEVEPEVVDDDNNSTFAADGSDPDPEVGDANEGPVDDCDKMVADIANLIEAAKSKSELSKAGEALKAAEGVIGEKAGRDLLGAWQAKFQELNKKK